MVNDYSFLVSYSSDRLRLLNPYQITFRELDSRRQQSDQAYRKAGAVINTGHLADQARQGAFTDPHMVATHVTGIQDPHRPPVLVDKADEPTHPVFRHT